MAFDEAKFRKLAAENGYSDEEIENHIGKLTNKATGQQFGAASDKATKEAQQAAADAGIPMPGATAADNRSNLEKLFNFAASPLGTAAIGLLGVGGYAAAKKGLEARKMGQQPMPEKVEPTLITPTEIKEASNPVNAIEKAKERLAQGKAAGLGVQPPAQPSAPTYNVPTAQTPAIGVPAPAPVPAQTPVGAAPVEPATPSVAQAVAIGESPSKAVQLDVAKQLDQESGIAGRVRRTKAQIEAAAAELQAKAPPGMKVDYKKPAGGIGVGPYHWFENQVGPEQAPALWRELFGERNVPLKEVQETYRNFAGSTPEPYAPRGGTHGKTPYVPQYIKGSIDPMMALNLAGNALGAAGLMQAYKEGKKTDDYSDLGMGAIGQILGNVAPRASMGFSLMTPSATNKGEKEELAKRRAMKPTID